MLLQGIERTVIELRGVVTTDEADRKVDYAETSRLCRIIVCCYFPKRKKWKDFKQCSDLHLVPSFLN